MSTKDGSGRVELAGEGRAIALPLSGKWYLLHTKSRQEKLLADELQRMGIGHFLPLFVQTRLYGHRKFQVELPLFPSYVFLRGCIEDAYQANRTHRVARIIEVADQSRLQWELSNLHLALGERASLDPFPFLKKGIRAEVRSGPLRGLQGLVEHRSAGGHLVLQVEMLGRALNVELSGVLVEPI
jgi:transcription antitermination factor NusG